MKAVRVGKNASRNNKVKANRVVNKKPIGIYANWVIYSGQLRRPPGRPQAVRSLFTAIAEKLPFDSLKDVCNDLRDKLGHKPMGVYIAHDSMGYPRYIGRGYIKARLGTRFKARREELKYYSFYVLQNKLHEREIETLLIHSAAPLLDFNEKKKRAGIQAGSVGDFEVDTRFYVRKYKRGLKPK